MATKKDKSTVKKSTIEPIIKSPTLQDFDELWDVVEEMQKNLDFVNDRVQIIMNRMGLQ